MFTSYALKKSLVMILHAVDKCTLCCDRNVICRWNVKVDVDGAANPYRNFFWLGLRARLVALTLEVLGFERLKDLVRMSNIKDAPNAEKSKHPGGVPLM